MEEKQESSGADLDSILVRELGQFGRFQARTLALAAVVVVFAGMAASEFVFTTARINTRCLIPECESLEEPAEFSPPWLGDAVPGSGGSFDGCRRFASAPAAAAAGTCPADLFDRNRTVDCEHFVYENTNTVVYNFELACEEWLRSLIGSVHIFGTLTAMPITGFVSDRWGRRPALVVFAFARGCIGLARSWADSYVLFIVMHFLQATFGFGAFSCAYILILELMGPKYRVIGGATVNTFFAVGKVCAGLLAWAVPQWRQLHRAVYAPMFICIFYYWIMPESVRWYMSKGRYAESEAVLRKAARVNGTNLSERSLMALRESEEEEKKRKASEATQRSQEPWLIVQVFKL